MSAFRQLPPGPGGNGYQRGAEAAAGVVGAAIGGAWTVAWGAVVGLVRLCVAYPRTTAVAGSLLVGFLLGGYLGALLVLYGFLLGLWWVLVNAPEALAKALGRPQTPVTGGSGREQLGPAQACPACGRVHVGDVWLVGPDPQGAFHCFELSQRRDYR